MPRRDSPLERTQVYPGVFPKATWLRLRRLVQRASSGRSTCLRLDEAPRTFFEQVVLALKSVVNPPADCVLAEYWMRSQKADTGFHYHFDRDGTRSPPQCPRLSTILYLSDVGGPTLLLNVTPTRTPARLKGKGITPRQNQLAVFAGELLHGVNAGEPSRWPRVAFYVNWWVTEPVSSLSAPAEAMVKLGPRLRRPPRALTPRALQARDFEPTSLLDRDGWARVIEQCLVAK